MENETVLLIPLPSGTLLREYQIQHTLGQGGMGIVYAATHEIFQETFAIKEFLPTTLATRRTNLFVEALPDQADTFAELREKFLAEGQILRQLAKPQPHPNLAQVTDAFYEYGTVYLCMSFEQGHSLESELKRRKQQGRGPITGVELLRWFLPLLDGLERVHAHQVWHRDIKPANILLREDGTPVLIDFGAARRERSDGQQSVIAQYTPRFAAPEQLFNGVIGAWTDIYSLAATGFYLLTNQNLTQPLPADWRTRCIECSTSLLDALEAGLQLDPTKRPTSIAQWRIMFEDYSNQEDSTIIFTNTTRHKHISSNQDQINKLEDEVTNVEPRLASRITSQATITSENYSALFSSKICKSNTSNKKWIAKTVAVIVIIGLGIYLWLIKFQSNLISEQSLTWFPPTLPQLPCAHLVWQPISDQSRTNSRPSKISLSGYLRDSNQFNNLLADLNSALPEIRIETQQVSFAEPFCDLLQQLENQRIKWVTYSGLPEIVWYNFNNLDRSYHEGEYLTITARNYSQNNGYLMLDTIDREQQIVHLFPNPNLPENKLISGQEIRVGAHDPNECKQQLDNCFILSPPLGNNLLLITWSAAPLLFDKQRWRVPQSESIQDYLHVLQDMKQQNQIELGYQFFNILARQ